MVVRDEEKDLPRCLDSVRGVADEIVVVDTGSSDQTVAIARRYGAIVREIPWKNDFAAARNHSLQLASGDWVLYLDADEALLPDGRHLLPTLLSDPAAEGYFLTIQSLLGPRDEGQYQVDQIFRLFRNRPHYRFIGPIHEQIVSVIQNMTPGAVLLPSPLRIVHYGYLDEYVQGKRKHQRNLRLLQDSLKDRPGDPFVLYNIGMQHVRMGADRQAKAALAASLAKAPAQAPWRPALIKWYAQTLSRLERWQAALAVLGDGTRQYPDYTDLHYLTGQVHAAVCQWDAAIRCFETCIKLGPAPSPPYSGTEPDLGLGKAHYSRGRALEEAGRCGDARDAYTRAASARPGWMVPLVRLARLLAAQGDDRELLQVLQGQFPGDSAAGLVMQAMLLAYAGRYRLAEERLRPLAAAGEMSRAAGYVYAVALAKLGRCEEALAICGQAGWQGSAFGPKLQALTLYCRLQLDDRAAVGELTADPRGLTALYTDLAGLLWDEPAERLGQFLRQLPRNSLLSGFVTRERQAGG
jgi:tetratricopeptide (TPR) repeat protein